MSSVSDREPFPRPTLDYATAGPSQNVQVDLQADGGVVITVATRRNIAYFLLTVIASDLFGFLLVPPAMLIYLLLSSRRPRAVIRFSAMKLSIEETRDDSLGRFVTKHSWSANAIGEIRPNRFISAIYLSVPGQDSADFLRGADPRIIGVVSKSLADARDRFGELSARKRMHGRDDSPRNSLAGWDNA